MLSNLTLSTEKPMFTFCSLIISHTIKPMVNKGNIVVLTFVFSTGKYPNKLKIIKVIPIHKGDSKTDGNNYRPISLLYLIK